MNQLITTFNGGFPATLNDIRFLQQAFQQAFNLIAAGFKTNAVPNYIIAGNDAIVSTNQVQLPSPCLVLLNSEILYAESQTISKSITNGFIALQKEVSYNSEGLKVDLKNGLQHQTYQVNKAVLVEYSGAINNNLINIAQISAGVLTAISLETIYLNQIIATRDFTRNLLLPLTWQTAPLNTGFISTNFAFRKNALGHLEIKGTVTKIPTNSAEIVTLPINYRPELNINSLIYYEDRATRITLQTDGKLIISGVPLQESATLYFNNILIIN